MKSPKDLDGLYRYSKTYRLHWQSVRINKRQIPWGQVAPDRSLANMWNTPVNDQIAADRLIKVTQ